MKRKALQFCWLIGALLFFPALLFAQKKKQQEIELTNELQELIENLVSDTDEEFDFNYLFDRLSYYHKNPLNVNKATPEELGELGILNAIQVNNLLQYRTENGDLIAIYELQAIPGFDLQTIKTILPFVRVTGNIQTFRVPFQQMLYKGSNELRIRYERVLEEKAGYADPIDGDTIRYQGSPDKLYARFRHTYENRHSWGVTAEKDAGEEFFNGSNKKGFDFYSFHLYYRNLNKTVKAIALGDYNVNLGQGLILGAGFGAGKSSFSTSIKNSGRIISPFTSVNEYFFKRGVAAHMALTKNVEIVGFASYRKLDARELLRDSTDIDDEIRSISGFLVDGFHRTQTEISRRSVLPVFDVGGSFRVKFKGGHIAANGVLSKFNGELNRTVQVYNQFSVLSGVQEWSNFSLDYGYIYQNINFFGETALSQNGSLATLNGLLLGVDRRVSLAILHRYYQRGYSGLQANAFAESSTVNNENGLFLGFEAKPHLRWTINGYLDIYKHLWLRSSADAPSAGVDYLVNVNYHIKRTLDISVRYKEETKQVNRKDNLTKLDYLAPSTARSLRFHLSNKINKAWELRNRLQLSFFNDGTGEEDANSFGMLLYQDILFSPIGSPFSFKGRISIFDTEDYDSRIYTYENDLIGAYSIPAFADRGLRYYLNIRYKGIRNLMLECRIAQTYYDNLEEIGSSREEIAGNKRTEVKVQAIYKF